MGKHNIIRIENYLELLHLDLNKPCVFYTVITCEMEFFLVLEFVKNQPI